MEATGGTMPVNTFTIRPGDTLAAIAKKLGVKLGALIDLNNIRDPNKIKVGQVLTIPSTTTDTSEHPVLTPPPAPTAVPAKLAIDQQRFRLTTADYFAQVFPKDLIVLHYTAGASARSAYDTWIKAPEAVATAYLVDLDGAIYECFDPKFWAYHLGVSGPARTHRDHKRSIGIELTCVGPLREDPVNKNQLNWWPANYRTKYCMKSETAKYVKQNYRGFDYHAAFTPAQVAQTVKLVRHLCDRFGIPKQIPPPAKRQEPKADFAFASTFKGVISHQSFSDNRVDIGPGWDWSALFG
jgi:hypothetical protein